MKSFLKNIKSLVSEGDQFLSKQGHAQFHKKAASLLINARLHEKLDYQQIVTESFEKKFNHEQNFKFLEFSDLPITLARGKHCFIDLYFWRRRPTVIHNHHFKGAFQCLYGSNVDLEFKYTEKKKIGKFHGLGQIKQHDSRVLKSGDIAEIDLLGKFIHQNHHQADLTINLCFRTPDIGKKNLSNYYFSGLRFEKAPHLLLRVERLMRFAAIDDFDHRKINLTLDDAIAFLIQTHDMGSQNSRLIRLQRFLDEKVKKECSLNISELITLHDKKLDLIIDKYE